MRIKKSQYALAVNSAAQNANILAVAKKLNERETRSLVLRAVISRQLELLADTSLTMSTRTTGDMEELEALSRRLGDLCLDHAK